MSKKKLTLSIDENVIRRAKRFSKRHDTSVSQLVTEFLSSLEDERSELTPTVSRLRGLLSSGVSVEDYHRHLEKKYGR